MKKKYGFFNDTPHPTYWRKKLLPSPLKSRIIFSLYIWSASDRLTLNLLRKPGSNVGLKCCKSDLLLVADFEAWERQIRRACAAG